MFKKVLQVLQVLVLIAFLLVISNQEVLAADYYGAIAYSPRTGSYGYSYDHYTQREAENAAHKACENYARSGDCEALVWFKNACGALAVGDSGYGSGWGTDRYTAESYAINSCSKYSGNCKVIHWNCTTQ